MVIEHGLEEHLNSDDEQTLTGSSPVKLPSESVDREDEGLLGVEGTGQIEDEQDVEDKGEMDAVKDADNEDQDMEDIEQEQDGIKNTEDLKKPDIIDVEDLKDGDTGWGDAEDAGDSGLDYDGVPEVRVAHVSLPVLPGGTGRCKRKDDQKQTKSSHQKHVGNAKQSLLWLYGNFRELNTLKSFHWCLV
ncbi:hypothetical protein IW262DRAFT_1294879 [Armillaria fumosa]|nr:hypothetical protein IW262DRAFT_1294879 [Armillaria fumosa]